jgi:hypothetical protein
MRSGRISKSPTRKHAQLTAVLVPIAQPLSYLQVVSPNWKMLFVIALERESMMTSAGMSSGSWSGKSLSQVLRTLMLCGVLMLECILTHREQSGGGAHLREGPV